MWSAIEETYFNPLEMCNTLYSVVEKVNLYQTTLEHSTKKTFLKYIRQIVKCLLQNLEEVLIINTY